LGGVDGGMWKCGGATGGGAREGKSGVGGKKGVGGRRGLLQWKDERKASRGGGGRGKRVVSRLRRGVVRERVWVKVVLGGGERKGRKGGEEGWKMCN